MTFVLTFFNLSLLYYIGWINNFKIWSGTGKKCDTFPTRSTFSLLSSSSAWRRRILAPKTNWRCQSFWRIVRPVSSSVGCGQAACPAANNRSWPNRELLEARYLLCPPQRGSSQHKQLVVRKICENLKAQRQAINSFGLTHKMSLCNLTPNHTKVSDDKGHRGPLKRQMIRVRGDKSAGHLFSPDRLVHRLLLWQLPFSELEELWSWLGGKERRNWNVKIGCYWVRGSVSSRVGVIWEEMGGWVTGGRRQPDKEYGLKLPPSPKTS